MTHHMLEWIDQILETEFRFRPTIRETDSKSLLQKAVKPVVETFRALVATDSNGEYVQVSDPKAESPLFRSTDRMVIVFNEGKIPQPSSVFSPYGQLGLKAVVLGFREYKMPEGGIRCYDPWIGLMVTPRQPLSVDPWRRLIREPMSPVASAGIAIRASGVIVGHHANPQLIEQSYLRLTLGLPAIGRLINHDAGSLGQA